MTHGIRASDWRSAFLTNNTGAASQAAAPDEHVTDRKEQLMLGTILIIVLILALCGALPRWSHSRNWGYAPTGGLGVVLLVVVVLLVLGRI
jgi:hypothetical protein